MSTLAEERANNHLLSYKNEDEFVSWFPTTFPIPPSYFFHTRPINQAGPRLRRDIAMPRPMPPNEFQAAGRESMIIDVRPLSDYTEGHIHGALSNTFRGVYATWLGWLVERDAPLLFVSGGTPMDEVIADSLLVGHEGFAGWLEGGMEAWAENGLPVVRGQLLDARQSHDSWVDGAVALDVRETREFQSGHLPYATHIPLGSLEDNLGRLPNDRPILAYCGHGERSATGLSILERRGFDRLLNLNGREAGYPVE